MDLMVSGLVIAWRFATSPTLRSPSLNETTDGVVRFPSGFAIITGSPPSITDTHEFVVPKSIPIILLMIHFSSLTKYLLFINFNHCWRSEEHTSELQSRFDIVCRL